MKIIEQFICGKKNNPDLCEDMIVVTGDFLAVIDGSTSKTCPEMAGLSAGRFAAQVVGDAIRALPADCTGAAAMAQLTQALRHATAAHMPIEQAIEKPTCSLAIYSRARQEVWRVGDIGILLDGDAHMSPKPVDDVTARARAMMIETLLLQGKTPESLQVDDLGRAFILPLLRSQHIFANLAGDHVFGYGVMNGDDIPAQYINVLSAKGVREIVLASDGYPILQETLTASEEALREILQDDPLLYKRYASTKGLQAGQVSFDDRSYLRFEI